jgi:hypothetical protein
VQLIFQRGAGSFSGAMSSKSVAVGLRHYVRAFFHAIERFSKQIQRDSHLRERVDHHVGKLALQVNFQIKDLETK